MLICPQCQFENPDENRFCQECGTPLNLIICPECGTRVPFSAEQCHNCHAVTGTYWWAIIAKSGRSGTSPTGLALDSLTYLDEGRRYQVVEVLLPPATGPVTQIQTRVLDHSPFQLSPLELLVHDGKDLSDYMGSESAKQLVTQLPDPWSDDEDPPVAEPASTVVVPQSARPYLSLYSQFHQALPLLHDAWVQHGREVLLLEDRSQLQPLFELWSDEDVPVLQVLHWLHEMAELWAALEPWQCRQSLLELKNLRVDEDQVLCLQQLYAEEDGSLSLKQLGQLWQELFSQTQRTQIGPLATLLEAICSGKISTIEGLQARIYEIASDLQAQEVPSSDLTGSDLLEGTALDASEYSLSGEMPTPAPDAMFLSELPEDLGLSFSTLESEVSSSPEARSALEMSPLYQRLKNQVPEDAVTGEMEFSNSDGDEPEEEDDDDESKDLDDTPTIVLPMQLYSLEDAGRTDVGRQRDHNEDCYGIVTELQKVESPTGRTLQARGLYILCDGMGGHASGEVASALAVNTIKEYFQTHWFSAPDQSAHLPAQEEIRQAVHLANKALFDINQQNARSGSGRMGTTMVLILAQGTKVAVAHVGDSRLYCVSRRRGLEQLTTDHDVGQREIQRGVEPAIAYARPDAYQLTQALGPRDENYMNPDVQFFDITEDSLFLLCSDGLTDNDLLESHWRTYLEPLLSSQANLDRGVAQLIDLANEHNGHDNITAVLVRMKVRPNLDLMKR